MRLLLLVALTLTLTVPTISYSENTTSYVLEGNGFGTTKDTITGVSIESFLQIPTSGKPAFDNGQFVFGDKIYSIKDMNLSILYNKKLIKLSAVSDEGISLSASGRIAASAGDSLIYLVNGKTSEQESKGFSLFVKLRQDDSAQHGLAGILPQDTIIQNIHDLEATKQNLLILVEQSERVQWKNPYQFTVKIFNEKANQLSNFDKSSGYVNGATISATITNPSGQIIKSSSGMTKNLGIYEDSVIIPDNARTGTYILNVTASADKFNTTSKQFEFYVVPLNTGS